MKVLQIPHSGSGNAVSSVNLTSCLDALQPFAQDIFWQVAPVINAANAETFFEVTGDLEPVFMSLMTTRQRIPSRELVGLSQREHQLIWTELQGFDHFQGPEPAIYIRAIDSTFFEIETGRPDIIEHVRKCFKNVVIQEDRWGNR